MVNSGKKSARLRLIKRVGLIGLISSSVIAVIFVILSFISRGNAAFTVRIDNPHKEENSSFKMFTSGDTDEPSRTYLAADPMENTALVESKEVEAYLDSLEKKEGSQNFVDEKYSYALVYTIYLNNISTEDIEVRYVVCLDGYQQPEKPKLTDYFRVLIQTEVDEKVTNTYYGQARSKTSKYANYINDNNDDREVIGKAVSYLDEEGRQRLTVPNTWDMTKGNDGYCINFHDFNLTKDIINSKVKIPANKMIRFTYVAFFEGEDPDSFASIPEDNSYLLLSLHFGE